MSNLLLKAFLLPFIFSLFSIPLIGQENMNGKFEIQEYKSSQDANVLLLPMNSSCCSCKPSLHLCRHKHRHHKPGPTGATGPAGPTGPTGPTLATFISLYALSSQDVNMGFPVLFDASSAQNGPITWPGANNGEIVIGSAGTYRISFGIQLFFNGTLSLRVNNTNVPGGTLAGDLSIPPPTVVIDVQIPTDGAIVSLVNTGTASLTLTSAGPTGNATIAFIEIHKIL